MNAWRLEVFEELGSTSDLCQARAQAGEPAGLAVLALRQTAGRGSRGRGWRAPAGNLNLSVLLRPDCGAHEAGSYALLAGIAVAEALDQAAGVAVQLKWPNDVLLGGAKLAGILIESSAGARLDWLSVGIGINLAEAPEIPGRMTTALRAHGAELAPLAAADAILAALARWLAAPAQAIRDAWLARAHPVGTELTVQSGHATRIGRFAGLSPAGELLLACNDRIEPISTGDVLLGRA